MISRAQTERPRAAAGESAAGGALPNLVVIGAQKCGTTALHYYLVRHPEISMSRLKEVNFFVEELNWSKGLDWYKQHFRAEAKVRGESSPDYTAHPWYSGVPGRMARIIPDARLIFMVRDPLERIHAQWVHNYANRSQHKPLQEAVLEPGSTYIPRSSYHLQLSRFLEHYPYSQVLVLDQEDLLSRRRETLRSVFRFLDVDDSFWHRRFEGRALETAGRRRRTPLGVWAYRRMSKQMWRRVRDHPPFTFPFEHTAISDELRQQLVERLSDDVARFRELTGSRFESWSL